LFQQVPPRATIQQSIEISFLQGNQSARGNAGNKSGPGRSNTLSKGKIKPVIDIILPFSNMVEGHVKMADSQLFGKILTTLQRL